MGAANDNRLTPLARAAVNSWSALNRPNTSTVEVNMAIGNAKANMKGINNPKAFITIRNVAWPFTSSGRISRSALPTNNTKVNTNIVITNEAIIWRNKYLCNVFKFYQRQARENAPSRKYQNAHVRI
jgi:hypothetical protein